MGIKKLKKENEFLSLTIVDMLSKFDTSKTKKYTQFLTKMLLSRLRHEFPGELLDMDQEIRPIEKTVPADSFENYITRTFVCDYLFSWGRMDMFIEFCDLMERGLISEKDITKFDSWEMLEKEFFVAKNKSTLKKAEKEIHIIPSDERFLIFKPLTYLASTTYGYQTKWCTAMVNDPTYFYSHSKGILIYLIDKETNKKFAFHKRVASQYEFDDFESLLFTTWNEEDKKIDTIQTGLPYDVLKIILNQTDTTNPNNKPNYEYFSEDELKHMANYTDFPGADVYREKKAFKHEIVGNDYPVAEDVVLELTNESEGPRYPRLIPRPTVREAVRSATVVPINREQDLGDFIGFELDNYSDDLPDLP